GGTSRFNRKGQIYQSVCAGCGGNDDFPIFPSNAHSPLNQSSNCNNGVFKFDFQLPLTVADFFAPSVGCINEPIQFTNTSAGFDNVFWDFGDDNTSTQNNPIHTYDTEGDYLVQLVVNNPGTCNETDTLEKWIEIRMPESTTSADGELCVGESLLIGAEDELPGYSYSWSPIAGLDNPNSYQTNASPSESTQYTLLLDNGVCVDTLYQFVEVDELTLSVSEDIIICDETEVIITAFPSNPDAEITWSPFPDFGLQVNDGPNDPDINPVVSTDQTYYVLVETELCSRTDSVNVLLFQEESLIEGDLIACLGDTITLSVVNPSSQLNYSWEPADLVLTGQDSPIITAVVTEDQAFVVTADDGAGCSFEDDAFVQVSELNGLDVSATATPSIITEGQACLLGASGHGGDVVNVLVARA
ncbi:MAG: PKD domain-containing protein, partial [Bacteroidota bacterium]